MKVLINNMEYKLYPTECGYIVTAEIDCDLAQVTIIRKHRNESVIVRPLKQGIKPLQDEYSINFECQCPIKLSVEFDDNAKKPLFLFLYQKEVVNTESYDYYFSTGEHYLEQLDLKSNQSVYIEAGAIVRTHVLAEDCENIGIHGRGILDTTGIGKKGRRMAHFLGCNNISIKDISIVGAISWSCVLTACRDVEISGVNIITWEVNGDGFDIVGCEDVNISDCFIHAADDCITIKATAYDSIRGCKNNSDMNIRGCILWNTQPGNAIEIGYETRCDEICNILFEDIDVIHCQYEGFQSGGVITIHNGDRARIHHISYINIRIEDAEEKLFDFKILQSKYSKDEQRGYIDNILVKDIYYFGEKLPPSILRGFCRENKINNITFENVRYKDIHITSLIDAHMIVELCYDINFI